MTKTIHIEINRPHFPGIVKNVACGRRVNRMGITTNWQEVTCKGCQAALLEKMKETFQRRTEDDVVLTR